MKYQLAISILFLTFFSVTCADGSRLSKIAVSIAATNTSSSSSSSVDSTVAGALNSSWTPAWANLIAYWTLDETTTGTVNAGAADFADTGSVGTHVGTHMGTHNTYGVTGKIGKSVTFTDAGVGTSCITIPAHASFNTTTLTAMAWFKTTDNSIGNILSFYNAANSFEGWAMIMNTNAGKVGFWAGTANGFMTSNTGSLNDGTWHHFAAVANGTNLKLYVDGALDRNATIVAIPNYTGQGVIGADGDCDQIITGTLDEIAVWDGPLSGTDINTIYQYQNTH